MPPFRLPTLAALAALLLAAAGPSHAQPTTTPRTSASPSSGPVATDAFLGKHVIAALIADGVDLSRVHLVLELDPFPGFMVVRLRDRRTLRPVATATVARVPSDRAHAVAVLAPVVARMLGANFGSRRPSAIAAP